jgi:hypothetical protein
MLYKPSRRDLIRYGMSASMAGVLGAQGPGLFPTPGPGQQSGGGGGCSDPPSGTQAINENGRGTTRVDDFSGRVGCKFTANANITVTGLARWVVGSSLAANHNVTLRDSSYVVLATAVVPSGAASADAFKFKCIDGVALTSGLAYYIMSEEGTTGDPWYNYTQVTVTSHANITITDAIYEDVGTPNVIVSGVESYGPVSFLFT